MKTIFLMLALAIVCYSQESEVYLIYKDKLPISLDIVKAKGIKTITEAGGQPFRITHWVQAPNTNYFLISIVPRNQTEINFFTDLISNNYILPISAGNVVTKHTRFGDRQIWEEMKFNDLPDDFNIEISTP